MDHFTVIISAEQQFAKEVVLNVLYLRPPKMWQNLIPGMFIFDFLRRGRAIRRYTKKYMFPRHLALDAVRELSAGDGADMVTRRIKERIDAELHPLLQSAPTLADAYYRMVELLTGHYGRLTQARGESYPELVRNAYPTAGEYEHHLNQLADLESEVDKAVVELAGPGKTLGQDLQLEADQVAVRRRGLVEKLYDYPG